jgi:hypothetical protein
MTSEIVVMNSLAVALATDSAATVTAGSDNKIYNAADKLFMLSKHHPVGVMVYSNASLLGVPWEAILKMFRRILGSTEYPRLVDYGDRLIQFLNDSKNLFPQAVEDRFYLRLVRTLFDQIADSIHDQLYAQSLENAEEKTADEKREFAKKVIFEMRDKWSKFSDVTCFEARTGEAMATRHSGKVNELMMKAFEDLPRDADMTTALRDLAILLVGKSEILREALSGIVIAGFGRDEHFPVMQSFELGEIYQGKLKYRRDKVVAIDGDSTTSIIVPFAHAEMVNTFLFGVKPELERRWMISVVALISKLPETVIDLVTDLSAEQRDQWKSKMAPVSGEIARDFFDKLTQYRRQEHLNPIYQAIANMSKGELAHAAASLVNLNSFQKRMSMDAETVGGPIDVAVISKGDGFIWTDRKHYFKPQLNQHFFRNYYADTKATGERDDPTPQAEAGRNESDASG